MDWYEMMVRNNRYLVWWHVPVRKWDGFMLVFASFDTLAWLVLDSNIQTRNISLECPRNHTKIRAQYQYLTKRTMLALGYCATPDWIQRFFRTLA